MDRNRNSPRKYIGAHDYVGLPGVLQKGDDSLNSGVLYQSAFVEGWSKTTETSRFIRTILLNPSLVSVFTLGEPCSLIQPATPGGLHLREPITYASSVVHGTAWKHIAATTSISHQLLRSDPRLCATHPPPPESTRYISRLTKTIQGDKKKYKNLGRAGVD